MIGNRIHSQYILVALGVISLTAIVSLAQEEVGTCSYPQAEYHLAFPAIIGTCKTKSLSMIILDSEGRPSPAYPVVDYDGVAPIRSNTEGTFVIHHCNLSPEHTTRLRRLFWFIPLTTADIPDYILQISCGGEVKATIYYSELVRRAFNMDATQVSTWDFQSYKYPESVPYRLNPYHRLPVSNRFPVYRMFFD